MRIFELLNNVRFVSFGAFEKVLLSLQFFKFPLRKIAQKLGLLKIRHAFACVWT